LLGRGCRGIATTHYGTLKTFAYNTPGLENASVEFDSETLAPTYRLMIGIPGRSNAFSIAEKLGLSKSILDMAKTYISDRQMKVSDLLENLEETQREVELDKLKVQEELQKAATQNAQMNEKARRMDEKQEEILQKAKDEALEIVRRSKQEAEKVILEIMEAQKEEQKKQQAAIEKARHGIKKLSDGLYGGKGAARSNLRPDQVFPGQMVYLPNLRQKGQVITKPDNSGEVIVQAGILKISVPISDIRIIDETRKTEHFEKTIKGSMGLSKAVTLRSEVDLRGTMVDEATEILDKYLDDAVLTGINQVSIIHGKGTGSLRNGVHQFLKRHPHVVNFRLGEYGEGESGVTIVDLK
jgi:DNA mismatch repair protein MutS2